MASPEDIELSWEALSKALEEEREKANMEELEKATENLDVVGNSVQSSPPGGSCNASSPDEFAYWSHSN
ncbi:hypothetical protein PG984_011282 [Apiospora sp. TS-2023a]